MFPLSTLAICLLRITWGAAKQRHNWISRLIFPRRYTKGGSANLSYPSAVTLYPIHFEEMIRTFVYG